MGFAELLPGGFVDGLRLLGGLLLAALVALALFGLLAGFVTLRGVRLRRVGSDETGRGDQGQEECEFQFHRCIGLGFAFKTPCFSHSCKILNLVMTLCINDLSLNLSLRLADYSG